MLINGQSFDGTFDFEYTDGQLKNVCANNISIISEFTPVRFPDARMIYKFLLSLFREHICCFVSGTYVLYISGCLDAFDGMTLYIAMTDALLLTFIFQKVRCPNFSVNEFSFRLVRKEEHDVWHYVVTYEKCVVPVTVYGIDTTEHCGPLSNIDFVHFVWKHFFRFSYKKRALALSPRGTAKLPKLMFLKYYRAESDAWKDTVNCDDCVERHKAVVEPFHSCDLSTDCACKICVRQPPTLADSARHVLFNYTLNMDSFKLTIEKTYSEYVSAVHSNRVPQDSLLPPETPTIRLWFQYEVNSPHKHHYDCPGAGSWDSNSVKTYSSKDAIIEDLISLKDHFWCHHCERGLFFPNSCLQHVEGAPAHVEDVEEGDVEDEVEEEEEEE